MDLPRPERVAPLKTPTARSPGGPRRLWPGRFVPAHRPRWPWISSAGGSSDGELNALDHVAHEAATVPVRLRWLHFAVCIPASHLQLQCSGLRRPDLRSPLAKAVAALIRPQVGRLPAAPVGSGEVYERNTAVAAEGDTSDRHESAGFDDRCVRDVGEERARHEPADGHGLESRLSRVHARVWRVG